MARRGYYYCFQGMTAQGDMKGDGYQIQEDNGLFDPEFAKDDLEKQGFLISIMHNVTEVDPDIAEAGLKSGPERIKRFQDFLGKQAANTPKQQIIIPELAARPTLIKKQ